MTKKNSKESMHKQNKQVEDKENILKLARKKYYVYINSNFIEDFSSNSMNVRKWG